MKHFFLASALFVATLFSTTANATTGKDNPAVLQAFENMFSGAKDAAWTMANNLYKVSFIYNGQAATAFYNADGTQVAVSRNITADQLPVRLQAHLKKHYGAYWVSNLFEMNDAGGVQYYITLETAETKLVLQSQSSFSWGVFQKTKKG